MINEEGGVDPEQFRMEAMFDRMDCIGKGILGLTIQCAQCHSHKYDPLTQEEYYRMFAFLNNSHEANVAVYTPDEQMKRAEILRKIREIEDDLQHQQSRLAPSGWPRGRSGSRATSPRGRSSGRRSTKNRPAARSICRMEDGSFLAQGYAPTKHTVEMTVKTDVTPITAFRLELLNDPNLPLGGPGPVDQGDGGPDRVPGRGRAGRRTGTDDRGQVRPGHGRRQPARDAARRRSSTTRAARSA